MTTPGATRPGPEPPTRRPFLFARLADAVRRQDWAVVLIEIAVVVLGVVIGFQVTAWGQGRADRAKEQVYLRQLAGDLRETATEAERASERQRAVNRNVALALRAYRTPERPPLDSLSVWIGGSYNFRSPAPVLGTAQGIVSAGDLSLLSDDSLRAALPAYVERSRERQAFVQVSVDLYGAAFADLIRATDVLEMYFLRLDPSSVDSLAEADAAFPYPAGPRRTPFPTSAEAVLSDPEIYGSLVTAGTMSTVVLEYQTQVAEDAAEMLRLVERARGESE